MTTALPDESAGKRWKLPPYLGRRRHVIGWRGWRVPRLGLPLSSRAPNNGLCLNGGEGGEERLAKRRIDPRESTSDGGRLVDRTEEAWMRGEEARGKRPSRW
ncbi:hypothetical protein CISG_02531 [Coccidioides immitis RMSCC 3703]|uniref:Uncharacterized protein n=1 Tax=Coccidioides immitis RMSCC 3703 TaxID=454286 RepID=A0A0J8R824_COCIT|nr:hypothetical protein CISG_02531 [Coccidioides immitis RMSCC 3703]